MTIVIYVMLTVGYKELHYIKYSFTIF